VRARLIGRSARGELDRGTGIEGLRGGSGDDRLTGGRMGDRLEGGAGDNTLIGQGGNDTIYIAESSGIDDARCGAGRDSIVDALRWTYLRGDCERLVDEYYTDVPLEPAMTLLPGGLLEVAVFIEGGDEFELESPPARFPGAPRGSRVRSLGTVVQQPDDAPTGQATIRFRLSSAGHAYLGNGGKPVCVYENVNAVGYCLRVPQRTPSASAFISPARASEANNLGHTLGTPSRIN
jgi:Ca2+-binding RTX toxin-like protein